MTHLSPSRAPGLTPPLVFTLQEDLADLKEQITMYESAVKHGVVGLDPSVELENQLSDSCVDLGLKKSNRKNGLLHRYRTSTGFIPDHRHLSTHLIYPHPRISAALARLSDSKLPKDDAVRQLRAEMQRCLGCLKGKRQKIGQLQEELQLCQGQVSQLQAQLDEAKLCNQVRTTPGAGLVLKLPDTELLQVLR